MTEPPRADITETLARFPRERTWLLPALQAVQESLGHLPDWALADTGRHLRVPASEVYGVATHYPEFRLAPRGRHHVRVCTGVSCALLGGRALLDQVASHWRIKAGETGAGRELTLEAADCFFACSVAPVVEVDRACYGRVSAADVPRLEDWFSFGRRHGAMPAPPVLDSSTHAPAASAREAHARLVSTARNHRPDRLRLLLQTGTCGRAVGADALVNPLRNGLRERKLEAAVVHGACNGMCYAAPLVEVMAPDTPRFLVERVTPASIPTVLDLLASGRGDFATAGLAGVVWADHPWRGLTPVTGHA